MITGRINQVPTDNRPPAIRRTPTYYRRLIPESGDSRRRFRISEWAPVKIAPHSSRLKPTAEHRQFVLHKKKRSPLEAASPTCRSRPTPLQVSSSLLCRCSATKTPLLSSKRKYTRSHLSPLPYQVGGVGSLSPNPVRYLRGNCMLVLVGSGWRFPRGPGSEPVRPSSHPCFPRSGPLKPGIKTRFFSSTLRPFQGTLKFGPQHTADWSISVWVCECTRITAWTE